MIKKTNYMVKDKFSESQNKKLQDDKKLTDID